MEWEKWSFLGYGFAKAFESGAHLIGWYQGLWWFHTALVIGAIIYISLAFQRLTHIIVSPVNVFFRSLTPKGALRTIDLENTETLGLPKSRTSPGKTCSTSIPVLAAAAARTTVLLTSVGNLSHPRR
jgi:hypothetical protein